MEMLDTIMILRYLLNDNEKMADEAEKIKLSLLDFLAEIQITEPEVTKLALETYAEQNLDFVDCILYAYSKVKGYEIKTFDKKLKRLLEQNAM